MKVLITGISSGIGLSIANDLKEHEIWGVARRAPPDELPVRFTSCDVANWSDVTMTVEKIAGIWSHLDALIHCAGVQGAVGPAMELEPEDWISTVRANIEGAYFMVRAFFGQMKRAEGARAKIILFSGGGASKPRPRFSAYGCAKAA